MSDCIIGYRRALFAGAAAIIGLYSAAADAQQTTSDNGGLQLEQVVVTATHQASTVNKVPLSVTAETQDALDQQGIRNFSDLTSTVPGLSINQSLGTGLANIAIRGIQQGGQGAATTGFYLDDTPLQTRNVGGLEAASGNGTPLPPLFDLERVEVLRGPQGTLYGGSSEGGTIRYITPTPSLTDYSVYGRAAVNNMEGGAFGYNVGVAVGGPIIPDKLGFRVSVYTDQTSGYLDYVDPFSQKVTLTNVNTNYTRLFRGELFYKASANASITVSYLGSSQSTPDLDRSYTLSQPNATVIPTECYQTTSIVHSVNPTPVGTSAAQCAAIPNGTTGQTNGVPNGQPVTKNFTRAGGTYGPYTLGQFQHLGPASWANQPASTVLSVPTITGEYDFDTFSVKLINSYVQHTAKTTTTDTTLLTDYTLNGTINGMAVPQGGVPFLNQLPDAGYGRFASNNTGKNVVEELRFASDDPSSPLTWVAGIYWSDAWTKAGFYNLYDTGGVDATSEALFGITGAQRWGTAATPGPNNLDTFAIQTQNLHDQQVAAYAEVNYNIFPDFQVTLGVRQSGVGFSYSQTHYGPVTGVLVPSVATATASTGHTYERPFTPKAGIKYQITDDKMVYFSVAKGYRPGGVNAATSQNICGPALAHYGLPFTSLPTTYKSDTVWSYELGGKVTLFDGAMQLNGDVYRINWKDVQATQSPGFGCGIIFTANAGDAVSQGVELESQAVLAKGWTANIAYNYDDAHYTQDAAALNGTISKLYVALKGEPLATPSWTLDAGSRYDFLPDADIDPYVRVDARFAAAYNISRYPLGTYDPDANRAPSNMVINLRTGITTGPYDFNLFVNNLFDYNRGLLSGGRTGCNNAACSSYAVNSTIYNETPYNLPRVIGLELDYRQ